MPRKGSKNKVSKKCSCFKGAGGNLHNVSCPTHPYPKPLTRKDLEVAVEANGGLGSVMGVPYKLTVKSLGRTFKSEGQTLEQALRKIKITGGARAIAVLKVEKGEQVKERIINGNVVQKAFSDVGPTMKDFALRRIIELIGM